MEQTTEATYEKGVLRLATPLRSLKEGQQVWITIRDRGEQPRADEREAQLLRELESRGLLARFPALAVPPNATEVKRLPLKLTGEPLSETIIKARD